MWGRRALNGPFGLLWARRVGPTRVGVVLPGRTHVGPAHSCAQLYTAHRSFIALRLARAWQDPRARRRRGEDEPRPGLL
jgi:hypothetical protein